MKSLFAFLLLVTPCFAQLPENQGEVVSYLNQTAVTIKAGNSQGSGSVFVRDGNSYILSAAHVVDSLRSTRKVIRGGDEKTVVEFKPVTVMQLHTVDGKYVGKSEYTGKIVKYSNPEHGEDLVLIKLDKPDAFTTYSVIYDGELLPIGTDVQHVGSFRGEFGSNSYSKGYISQYGRVIEGKNYFQTTCTGVAGSSGGGIFDTKGNLYGILTRGSSDNINFCVDYRRIRNWLKRCNALWVLDHSIEVGEITDDVEVE